MTRRYTVAVSAIIVTAPACPRTLVAFSASKIAGTPNSRATHARWLVALPMSAMMPRTLPMSAAWSGEAALVTRIESSGKSAGGRPWSTRTLPDAVPGDAVIPARSRIGCRVGSIGWTAGPG